MSNMVNFSLDIVKLCEKYADNGGYMGSDGMVNGQPAFQHDLYIDGKKVTVYITN